MKIDHYTTYFHDGSVIDINQKGDIIIISLESTELSPDENVDNLSLSISNTIKGKLHIEGVENIFDNNDLITSNLRLLHDSAQILHFKICNSTVSLDLMWTNFSPHPKVNAYSFYTIHAKRVWWENIPDLYDPFG